jgi:hypothetical protein
MLACAMDRCHYHRSFGAMPRASTSDLGSGTVFVLKFSIFVKTSADTTHLSDVFSREKSLRVGGGAIKP